MEREREREGRERERKKERHDGVSFHYTVTANIESREKTSLKVPYHVSVYCNYLVTRRPVTQDKLEA